MKIKYLLQNKKSFNLELKNLRIALKVHEIYLDGEYISAENKILEAIDIQVNQIKKIDKELDRIKREFQGVCLNLVEKQMIKDKKINHQDILWIDENGLSITSQHEPTGLSSFLCYIDEI